ncbi:MAG: hypothetical protein IT320_11275 [Anaerolineae bacterium]|nr:hypothetical protein [Anaerolineae bacterium]
MNHTMFIFDYIGFRAEAQPLIEMADQGDYSAVFEKARKIARHIAPETWILEDLGTTLKGFPDNMENFPISRNAGLSFLIILSQFLEHSLIPPLGLGNIAKIGASLGWSEADIKLLSIGLSTAALMKPDLVTNPQERSSISDPHWHDSAYYWWWVQPENAFYTGWWDIEHMKLLVEKIEAIRNQFEQINVEALNLHSSVTKLSLHEDYENTITQFKKTILREKGLFYIIS